MTLRALRQLLARAMDSSNKRSKAARRRELAARKRRPYGAVESLETRDLLATINYTVDAPQNYLTGNPGGLLDGDVDLLVRIANVGGVATLQLVDQDLVPGGQVVGSAPLTGPVDIHITGYQTSIDGHTEEFPETLIVDLSNSTGLNPGAVDIDIDFDGIKGTAVGLIQDDQVIIAPSSATLYQPHDLNVTLTSGEKISVVGSLAVTNNVTLNAVDGSIEVLGGGGNSGVIQAGGNVQLLATATVTAQSDAASADALAMPDSTIAITGATITGADVTLSATATTNVTITAHDLRDGKYSVGGVVAISNAGVVIDGNTIITATGDLSIAATSDVTTSVTRGAEDDGDSSDDDKDQDAALAVSAVTSAAGIRLSDTASLNAAGAASLSAVNLVNVTTVADGTLHNGDSGGTDAGGTVATATVVGDTEVLVEDSAAIVAGGNLTIHATSNRAVSTTSKATAGGAAEDGDSNTTTTGQQTLADNNASTSDGDVTLAATIAVNTVMGETRTKITGGSLTSSGGVIDIVSSASHNILTHADGTTTLGNDDSGVGVAVAIGLAGVTDPTGATALRSTADVSGAVQLNAASISIQSFMPQATFDTEAKSGLSGPSKDENGDDTGADVGVAGALAIGVSIINSHAGIAPNAQVATNGADLSIQAQSNANSKVHALPKVEGGSNVGVGAAVALNITDFTTRGAIESNASLTGVDDLAIASNSFHTVDTLTKTGAAGGTAVAAAASIGLGHHDTQAEIASQGTLVTTGSVSVTSSQLGQSTTKSEGDATGQGDAAIGAAFSLNMVEDRNDALVSRSVTSGGALSIAANGTSSNTANAKASAAGEKQESDADTANAPKAQAQNQRAASDSQASSRGARNSQDATANPDASTSEGDLTVAAAIAVNLAHTRSRAAITGNVVVDSDGPLSLNSNANADATATADGSAVNGQYTIGAGVAINSSHVENLATIGGSAVVKADGVSLQALANDAIHSSLAQATSGAGGTDLGLAGSLAINLTHVETLATLNPGANVTLQDGSDAGATVGALTLNAISVTDSQGLALANASGDLGIGASIAFNINDQVTRATISDGAIVNGARDINVAAQSKHDVTTTAEGGAAGGTAITPVGTLTFSFPTTEARIGTQAGTLDATGTVTVQASHSGGVTAAATGEATGSDAAVGISLGYTHMREQVNAIVERDLEADGAVTITSRSATLHIADAKASATGADGEQQNQGGTAQDKTDNLRAAGNSKSQSNSNQDSGTNNKATASTADDDGDGQGDAITVAAAISVNVVEGDARARIADGRTIHSGGVLTVRSSHHLDTTANADGSASKGSVGIGAAVAINVVDLDASATIGKSQITADGLVVESVLADVPGESPDVDEFVAASKSGAGGSDVGVAGSLAINHIKLNASATIPDQAVVTLNDGSDLNASVGAVTVHSQTASENVAHALPDDPNSGAAGDVGVGASVAINLTYIDAQATIADGATWNGGAAASFTVAASADHTFSTEAQNGANGGSVGVGGAVGVVISKNHTLAHVGSGVGGISVLGPASVTAHHSSNLVTTVGSAAKGSDAAIGASVGVVIVEDTNDASLDRSVTAGGNVLVKAELDATSEMKVKASAGGGDSNGDDADTEANKQANQDNAGGANSNTVPKASDSSKKANEESGEQANSSSGGVGVAASVAVNALSLKNRAAIGESVTVTATSGDVTVTAPAHVISHTQADSTAVDGNQDVSVGAAVALNWVSLTNSAIVAQNSTVSGQKITIEAVTRPNETNDFTATAFTVAGNEGSASVAGVLALNVVDADTLAMTHDGVHLDASDDVDVTARHDMRVQAAAIAGTVSDEVSVAAAAAINILGLNEDKETGGSTTIASIGNTDDNAAAAQVDSPGAVHVSATHSIAMFPTLDLPNTLNEPEDPKYAIKDIDIPLASIAVSGGGSTGDFAAAGSAGINLHETSTWALIDREATVDVKSLEVKATDTTDLATTAGAIGVSSGGVGIGLGLDLNILHKDTLASIGRGADITTDQLANLAAVSKETLVSVGATAGVGNSLGAAASAAVQVVETTTRAIVEDAATPAAGAHLTTGGLTVLADDHFDIKLIAGSAGGGGTAGVGASNATLVHNDVVQALIGDGATIQSSDDVTVSADSAETYLTIGAAGAVGGSASFAGAAVVTVLSETTHATIGNQVTLNVGNGLALGQPSVTVKASDDTIDVSVGGSLSASGGVSAGIGADVAKVEKSTIASIGSGVTAPIEGDLVVDARSVEDVTSVVGGLAASSNVALTLDANVHVYDVTTKAFIGEDPRDEIPDAGPADVHAGGDVIVTADDRLEIDKVVGSVSVSGTAAFAAAAAVTTINKNVEAFLGNGARVTGDGKTSGHAVPTGKFVVSSGGSSSSTPGIESNSKFTMTSDAATLSAQGEVGTPALGDISTDTKNDGQEAADDPSLNGQRTLTPALKSGFHGVAVAATNRDDIEDYTISLAGGTAAFALSAGVNVLNVNTRAFVGTGAKVNESTATASADQQVLVAAGSDFSHVNFGGSVAAGQVGIGPAGAFSSLNEHTEARVGWDALNNLSTSATVNARDDVSVLATQSEDILIVGVGLAGGWVGIGAGIDVLGINNSTIAEVGAGSHVFTEGDLAVLATDATDLDEIAAGVGAGAFGGGGGVGVMSINKQTQARIADGAVVDARAKGDPLSGIMNGVVEGDGDSFQTTQIGGVVVQAHSTEDVLHLALAAAGGFVGAAGGVTITMVDSDTTAEIGDLAVVNQQNNNTGAASDQDVFVNAANEARIVSFAGAAAGGAGALGGAVDFGTLNNDTRALVGHDATIQAAHDVDVNALGIKDLDSNTFSGAGGIVALTGAVSVWSIGTPLRESYENESGKSLNASEDENKKSSTSDATTQVQVGRDKLTSSVGNFSQDPDQNDQANANRIRKIGQTAASRLTQGLLDKSSLDDQFTATTKTAGTTAEVGQGTVIKAKQHVNVQAKEDVELDVNVGGFAGGLGGVGASIGVYSVAANTRATSAGTIDAGGAVVVQATLDEHVKPLALAGAAGFVGLGAAVVDVQDHSHVIAELGSVVSATSVTLLADAYQDLPVETGQASFGAVGGGASFTHLVADGETVAAVLPQADIGQTPGKSVGSFSGKADSTIVAHATTVAITGGAASFSANFAIVDVQPTVLAEIGFGADVTVNGAATLRAIADHDLDANVKTFAEGAVSAGASISTANLAGKVHADVEPAATISAGSLTIESRQNHSGLAPTLSTVNAHAEAPGEFPGFTNGNGTNSTANSNTDVAVAVGDDVQLTTTSGNVLLRAAAAHVATADGLAVSIGLGAAVGITETHAHADGNTRLQVEGSISSAGSLTVVADATNTATAHGEAAAGGLGGAGIGVSSDATASPTVESLVYGEAKIAAEGNIAVTAFSVNTAAATGDGGAGGAVGIGVIQTSTETSGSAKTLLASDTDGQSSITVSTTATNHATSHGVAAAGGLLGAGVGVESTVDNQPTFQALLNGKARAATSIDVLVHSTNTVETLTEMVALSAGATGGGAVATMTSKPVVEARVEGGPTTAPTALHVHATDTSTVTTDAQAVAAGGGAYGNGEAHADVAAKVEAIIQHGLHAANDASIVAAETATINTTANGIAGGGVAIAGGKVVNEVANQVHAEIKDDVFLNLDKPGTGNVLVQATDTTELTGEVVLTGLGLIDVGGAATTYNHVANDVRANISGLAVVRTDGNVELRAKESQTVHDRAVGLAVSLGAGVAGNTAVNVLESHVQASIHNQALVEAGNNALVLAELDSPLSASGAAGAGGLFGDGGTVIVNTLDNTTRAFIDNNSHVQARADGLGLIVPKWNESTGVQSNDTLNGLAVIAHSRATPADDPDGNGPLGPLTALAYNRSGGFTGLSSLNVVNTIDDVTEAFIASSKVNTDDDWGGEVLVRAHADDQIAVKLDGTAGGVAGVGGAVDRAVINTTTRAFISDNDESGNDLTEIGSEVYGTKIEVNATSRETIDLDVLGVTGGAFAVAGSVSVATISAHTDALIRDSQVYSTGDLKVLADDASSITGVVSTDAVGLAAGGASIAMNVIGSTVRAQVLGGHLLAESDLDVIADSDETIDVQTRALSAAALALAGTVDLNVIETTTEAFVGDGDQHAELNQFLPPLTGQPPHQFVTIKADDTARITNHQGTLAGSLLAGAGASLEFGNIRNRTVAEVGPHSKIDASQDITIDAHADHALDSNVTAFGGGAIALAGALSFLTLGELSGDDVSRVMQQFLTTDDNGNSLVGQTDSSSANQDLSDAISDDASDTAATTQAASDRVNALGSPSVQSTVDSNLKDRITAARVADAANNASGATLHANRDVSIQATHIYELHQTVGTESYGLGSVGATVAVANIHNATDASLGDHGVIKASGDVTIAAHDANRKDAPIEVHSFGQQAGFVAVGVNETSLTIDGMATADVGVGATIAYADDVKVVATQAAQIDATGKGFMIDAVDGDANENAGAGDVLVNVTDTATASATIAHAAQVGSQRSVSSLAVVASAENTIDAEALVGHAALGGDTAGGTVTVLVTPTIAAHVDAATLDVRRDVIVNAAATNTVTENVESLAVIVIGDGAGISQATIEGSVMANVSDGATIDSGALNVAAVHHTTASANGNAIGGGLAGGQAAGAQIDVDMDVTSAIGDATVTSDGDVIVSSDSMVDVTSVSGAVAIQGVGEGSSAAHATILGDVGAKVRDGANIQSGGDVKVDADAQNATHVTATATNAGVANGSAVDTLALVDVNTLVEISGATINAQGNLQAEATATNTADADSQGATLSIVGAVGFVDAKAYVEGSTRAKADGSLHAADGFIRVQALDQDSHAVANSQVAGGGIGGSHQASTSDAYVRPSAGEPEEQVRARLAGNVTAGDTIAVRAKTSNAYATSTTHGISLAAGVSSGGTKATSELGQTVRSSIGNDSTVNAGADVKVEALHESGWSTATAEAAGGALLLNFTGADAIAKSVGDVVAVIGNADVTAGDTLSVLANATNLANATGEDLSIGGLFGKGDVHATATAGKVTSAGVLDGATLHANDLVVSALGNDRAKSDVAGTGGGAVSANAAVATTTVSPDIDAYLGDHVTATLTHDAQIKAESKSEGDATATAHAGGAIEIGEARAHVEWTPDVTASLGTNAHLDAAHDVNITSLAGKNTPTDGSGVSRAKSTGAGGSAFFGENGGKATVNAQPDAHVTIGARTIGNVPTVHAGHDVNLISDAGGNILAESNNASGSAGAAIGLSRAFAEMNHTSEVVIGNGAQLVADHDLVLAAKSDDISKGDAIAAAGSAVASGARAESKGNIDHQTLTTIGDHVQLQAANGLVVSSLSSAKGIALADADSGALIGSSNANAGTNSDHLKRGGHDLGVVIEGVTQTTLGKDVHVSAKQVTIAATIDRTDGESTSTTHTLAGSPVTPADIDGLSRVELYDDAQVDVGQGAIVDASDTATFTAKINTIRVASNNTTDLDGIGGATSDSIGYVGSDATVDVATGAKLTAAHQLSLLASSQDSDFTSESTARADGVGDASSRALGDYQGNVEITTADAALLTTHVLEVKALGLTGSHPFRTNATSTGLTNSADELGDYDPVRMITFDADVVLTSGKAVLVVGPNGEVLERDGVTFSPMNLAGNVDPAATTIVVDAIVNNHPGSALFQTNSLGAVTYGDANNGGTTTKSAPNAMVRSLATVAKTDSFDITFRESLDAVHIENQSNKNLVVGDIKVVNTTVKPQVTIDTNQITGPDPADFTKTIDYFGFDIIQSFEPTTIEILQTNEAAAKDITLSGVIDNPIGTTLIHNAGDDVLVGNGNALVRGNVVDVEAKGDIGASNGRLKVDLVASIGKPEQDPAALDPDPGFRAQGPVWLDVRGVNRDASLSNFTVDVGQVSGSTVDVAIRPASQETTQPATTFVVDVAVVPAAAQPYENHFRPDGSGPAANLPLGVFGTGGTTIDATYNFPLIASSGNVVVSAAAAPKKINVDADMNITGAGKVDVSTTGNVDVTEIVGPLQVGSITANGGAATLTSLTGDIVDIDNDAAADVTANAVTLHAAAGAIGSTANPLDINSSAASAAKVNANALGNVNLLETSGDLRTSVIKSTSGNVSLATAAGTILDADDDSLLNVGGKDVSLVAKGAVVGAIGETNDPLEVCATGVFTAQADAGIKNVKNLCGLLKIKLIQVGTGNVSIGGAGNIELVDGAQIMAPADVTLDAGGDVLFAPTTQVVIGGVMSVHAGSNAISGNRGATVTTDGTIQAVRLDIVGGEGDDTLQLKHRFARGTTQAFGGVGFDVIDGTALVDRLFAHGGLGNDVIKGGAANDLLWGDEGNDALEGGAGNDALMGDAGDDTLTGNEGRDLLFGGLGADLLDGGAGDDVMVGGAFRNSGAASTLDALLAAWGQPTTFKSRTTRLGRMGLKSSNLSDDRVQDRVFGGADIDWFWTYGTDISDRTKSEKLR